MDHLRPRLSGSITTARTCSSTAPTAGRRIKNIERDPRATVTVLPAEDQQSGYVMVSGTAELVEEGALEHINMLAKKYLGEDKYPYLGPARDA
jgi:Uncharacterized stress protein (general stress protein 26)